MIVRLACSKQIRPILTELLLNRDITILDDVSSSQDPPADVVIVESGFEYKQNELALVFSMKTIDKLVAYLDVFQRSCDTEDYNKVISGKSEDGYEVLAYGSISYFEGLGNHVFAVNRTGKYKVKEKLYELESKLQSQGFIRVSKSFIVNIIFIERIQPWFNGKLLLKLSEPKAEIEVTRSYVKAFKAYLGL